jgi:endonuclease YncB( thermonuclease family)
MEIVLLLLAVVAVFAFFRWLGKGDAGTPRKASTKRQSTTAHSSNRHQSTKTTQRNEPRKHPLRSEPLKPFDTKTAHHVSTPRVIEGPAYVTDGDTITIQKTQIRLYGIDAPELDHPYGKKAKWAMVRLCKGHKIRAVITDQDKYGRAVAKCSLPDGSDLSAELVKVGLAIDWPKYSDGQYSHLEIPGVRKKLWLADARQKGRMHVWKKFETRKKQER